MSKPSLLAGLFAAGDAGDVDAFEQFLHLEVIDLFVSPTAEAARCVVTGTMRGSYGGFTAQGHSFKLDQAVFAHVRDGKIIELWEIVDLSVLRQELGGA